MTSNKHLRFKTFLLILVVVVASPLGNVLLGKGMRHAGKVPAWPPNAVFHMALRVFGTSSIWFGIASLITSFVAYMLVLSWADYSYVQPASSISYAVVALLGYLLLGETVSPLGCLGILIICTGVFITGRTRPRTSPLANRETAGPPIQQPGQGAS